MDSLHAMQLVLEIIMLGASLITLVASLIQKEFEVAIWAFNTFVWVIISMLNRGGD